MKCASLLIVFILASSSAAIDKNPSAFTLTVSADRADCTYRCGELVTFTIGVTLQGKPADDAKVKWTLSNDGKEMGQSGVVQLVEGKATVSGKLDRPGFLLCRADVTPPGEKTKSIRASAAIDPLDIKPSLPAPEDFDVFWSDQKKKLAAVPMNVRITPVKSPVPNVECFDVQADGLIGSLSAYLARPIRAKPKSLPAIVLTHGSGVASSRLSTAAKWGADGFLALDFNAHGLPNDKAKDFYAALYRQELKDYFWKGRNSREETYFLELYLRLQRAIDVLTAQPEWNEQELVACGRSQGGGQAIVAGGLDQRVTYVAAEIPAFCDHTGIVIGRINGWPRLIPNDTEDLDPKAVNAVRYFDACNFASKTKARAFITVGFIDIVCPPTTVYAAYNQFASKKKIWNHCDTGHVSKSEYEAGVREAIMAHVYAKP